jgi:hypothetical protein
MVSSWHGGIKNELVLVPTLFKVKYLSRCAGEKYSIQIKETRSNQLVGFSK